MCLDSSEGLRMLSLDTISGGVQVSIALIAAPLGHHPLASVLQAAARPLLL